MKDTTSMYSVYALRDSAGDVLWVGQTIRPKTRIQQHVGLQSWGDEIFSTEWIHNLNSKQAREQERELIKTLLPKYNDILYKGTYQWEYRECGHKYRCNHCKSGKGHGPYLYHYRSDEPGKRRGYYIKLSELHKHPDAPPRPV